VDLVEGQCVVEGTFAVGVVVHYLSHDVLGLQENFNHLNALVDY
jgi:hypothetical protein